MTDQRRFCRVVLVGETSAILLTVLGPNPIILANDGRFIKMTDIKKNKEHFFNTDKVVHIQLEDERTDM